MKLELLSAVFVVLLLPSLVFAAASVTVSQSGADSGTVMTGKTFSISVSGASANAQATITNYPVSFSLTGEDFTKTTDSNGAVSWTTAMLSQSGLTAQTITVQISGQGSPQSATSSAFNTKTAPSLSVTISPTSTSVTQGSTFSFSLNIQNSGETTARFGTITVSPSDFSVSSGCSPSDISGSSSSALTCTIAASSSATTGSRTLTVTIAPTNANTITKTVSVTVNAAPIQVTTTAGGGAGGAAGNETTKVNVTRGKATITIPLIAAGKMAVVNITKTEDMAVRQITISVKNSVNAITINIDKLAQKPASITQEVSGKVYHYIEIKKSGIQDRDVDKVKIKFAVSKTWINENNIDSATVALNRHTTQWDKLTTTKLSETADEIEYEAESAGLSVFAISGEEKAAVAEVPSEEKKVPEEVAGISTTWIIGIIVILAILGFLVWKKRQS